LATTYPNPFASSTRLAGTGVAARLPSAFERTPDSVTSKAVGGAQAEPAAGLFIARYSDPSYVLPKNPNML
jgi:hypothetical protein